MVKSFINLNQQILAVYTPLVEEICLGKNVSRKELENLLDWLVSSCISDDVVELLKKVCRYFLLSISGSNNRLCYDLQGII